MDEQQRRANRRNPTGGGGEPVDDASSLDATRHELLSELDAAARILNASGRDTAEIRKRDQVPPGTFHGRQFRKRPWMRGDA